MLKLRSSSPRKAYTPGECLHCTVDLWCDPRSLGYEPNKRRRLDFGKDLWQDMKFTDMTMRAGDDGGWPQLFLHMAVQHVFSFVILRASLKNLIGDGLLW